MLRHLHLMSEICMWQRNTNQFYAQKLSMLQYFTKKYKNVTQILVDRLLKNQLSLIFK